MSAFAIVCEHTAQAQARLEAIYRSADWQQIEYFQEQIDPNVVAHNKLDISQTIEANLGLSAQLVGDRDTIIQRLKEYEAVGVDLRSSRDDSDSRVLPQHHRCTFHLQHQSVLAANADLVDIPASRESDRQ